MVDQIALVPFTTPASPGTLDITSSDITETARAVVLIWGTSVNDDTDENTGRMGIALQQLEDLSASETGGAGSVLLRHNVGTAVCETGEGNESAVILPTDGASGFDIVSTVDSVIPGGVRLSFATTTSQVKGLALILAGNSMRAWGGALSTTSTSPTQEDTGPVGDEFEPHLVLAIPAKQSLTSASRVANAGYAGFGAIVAAIQKSVLVDWDDGAATTDAEGLLQSAGSVGSITVVGRTGQALIFAINATGFTYAALNAVDTRCRYLAIRFGGDARIAVANLPVSGSTGVQSFTVGLRPDVVLGASSLLTTENSLTDGATAAALGYFITGPLGSRAVSVRQQEGVALGTTACSSRQGDHAVLTLSHTGGVAQQASWVDTTNGGFLLDFSSATAGHLTALAIQLQPSPAPPARRRRRARRVRAVRRLIRQAMQGRAADVGPPPLSRGFWKAIQRIRLAVRLRLRRPLLPPLTIRPEGLATDEDEKGRIFSPGALRGRIQPTVYGTAGRVFSPGGARGRISGPGTAFPEDEA